MRPKMRNKPTVSVVFMPTMFIGGKRNRFRVGIPHQPRHARLTMKSRTHQTRRQFLNQTAVFGLGTVGLSVAPHAHAANASDKIVLGVIGPGGMGTNLLKSFAAQPDVAVAWV